MLMTIASLGGIFCVDKIVTKGIDLYIKYDQLKYKEIELNGKESFINTKEKKINELIGKVYENKIKEVDKIKEICDECKIYQNKWTACSEEIHDHPRGITQLVGGYWKRTKCSVHGDIIGDFYDNHLISHYQSELGDVGKYFTINDILKKN